MQPKHPELHTPSTLEQICQENKNYKFLLRLSEREVDVSGVRECVCLNRQQNCGMDWCLAWLASQESHCATSAMSKSTLDTVPHGQWLIMEPFGYWFSLTFIPHLPNPGF